MKTFLLRPTLALAALLTAGDLTALAQAATDPLVPAAPGAAAAGQAKVSAPYDKKFIKDVAKAFYFELQLAEAAKTGANSEATKKYAKQVNDDLNKAWASLTELAQAKGETLPTELSGGDKSAAERLKKTKGDSFDKLYFRETLKEAKGVERDFASAVKMGVDPAVKTFATNYLIIVKSHVTEGEKAEKESTKK